MGSIFGNSKPKQRSVQYDQSYATMNSVPQYSSMLGGVGGGASGASFQRRYEESPKFTREDYNDEERATTGQIEK